MRPVALRFLPDQPDWLLELPDEPDVVSLAELPGALDELEGSLDPPDVPDELCAWAPMTRHAAQNAANPNSWFLINLPFIVVFKQKLTPVGVIHYNGKLSLGLFNSNGAKTLMPSGHPKNPLGWAPRSVSVCQCAGG